MLVELASLGRPNSKFAHNYGPGELELNEERITVSAPPQVAGQIQQTDGSVRVSGRIEAAIELECDRCLKPLTIPVANDFSVEYVTPETYQAGQGAELLDEDLSLSVFDGEVLDIDDLVREQLLLALPAQVLCREDCKGLCPVCGEDRNVQDCNCQEADIDPRWAGLKEISRS